jgi:hypothetical protein
MTVVGGVGATVASWAADEEAAVSRSMKTALMGAWEIAIADPSFVMSSGQRGTSAAKLLGAALPLT